MTMAASFDFMSLPKELRLMVYDFLAYDIKHLILYTGQRQPHYCQEPGADPVAASLGMVALSIPSIPGLPLLSICQTIRSEAHPIILTSLRKRERTPPRLIISYSDLANIVHSPFWAMLHLMLQKLVGVRAEGRRRTGAPWTADEVYDRHSTACVIKTPRPQTKSVARKLYELDRAQRQLFRKFLRNAQRHYRYLQDIGVRKRDVSRVELQVMLVGDVLRESNWAVGFEYAQLETRMLRLQFVSLEEEVGGEGKEAGLRRSGLVKLARHCTHEVEEGNQNWRPIGEVVSSKVWKRDWSSRVLEQYLGQS